jgi:Glu-tRNA(Gln) amidotransferase subunit E-like FAD-binding protein
VPSSADPERWRRDRLTAAGFPPELARQLAADRRVDLHAMLELVDRGCPPELAARILAPVEADLHRRDSRDRRH